MEEEENKCRDNLLGGHHRWPGRLVGKEKSENMVLRISLGVLA